MRCRTSRIHSIHQRIYNISGSTTTHLTFCLIGSPLAGLSHGHAVSRGGGCGDHRSADVAVSRHVAGTTSQSRLSGSLSRPVLTLESLRAPSQPRPLTHGAGSIRDVCRQPLKEDSCHCEGQLPRAGPWLTLWTDLIIHVPAGGWRCSSHAGLQCPQSVGIPGALAAGWAGWAFSPSRKKRAQCPIPTCGSAERGASRLSTAIARLGIYTALHAHWTPIRRGVVYCGCSDTRASYLS